MSDVQPVDPRLTPGRPAMIGFGLLFVLMLAATLILAAVVPRVVARKQKANRVKCANTLRQLGLGGLQYSLDKSVFPHVTGPQELDGDPTTSDTPRAWRMILSGGYVDSPEAFVCPVQPKLMSTAARRAQRREWFTAPAGQRAGRATWLLTKRSSLRRVKTGACAGIMWTGGRSCGWTRRRRGSRFTTSLFRARGCIA